MGRSYEAGPSSYFQNMERVNTLDGSVVWETPLGGSEFYLLGDIIVVSNLTSIRILDAKTGRLLAHYVPEPRKLLHGFHRIDSHIFAYDTDGWLYVFQVPGGRTPEQPAR